MKLSNHIKVKPANGSLVFPVHQDIQPGSSHEKLLRWQKLIPKISKNKGHQGNDQKRKQAMCQLASFQRATKWLIVLGQTAGLIPVLGVFIEPPAAMRFKTLSFRFIYSLIMFAMQIVIAIIYLLRMFRLTLSVKSIGYTSFYISSAITTILFIQVAMKWPKLVKQLSHYKLDEYIDPSMKMKCNAAIAIFLLSAIVEHVFAEVAAFATVLNCSTDDMNIYKKFIQYSYPWISELPLPDNILIDIATQFLNITATLTWNYSDVFIVCISFYLISILEGINKKLVDNRTTLQYLYSTFWLKIREDYSRAAQLVRAFDDVIGGVVLASFATNLFFICLQLFNLLSVGIGHKTYAKKCPRFSSGPFGGYEDIIYFTYSMVFVLFRYLSVSLIAARVHTSSQSLAPALYGVPSTVYNVEADVAMKVLRSELGRGLFMFLVLFNLIRQVQRLLEQVQHDTVALSGLGFFYITKSLVLTVAGTIFTYELVLLQYGG